MNVIVTKDLLSDAVREVSCGKGLSQLRKLIFNYYYAEDDYTFEPETLGDIFPILATYFEWEETFRDEKRNARFSALARTFEQGGWSKEHTLFALYRDEIQNLTDKLRSGLINREVFTSQIKRISQVDLDWDRIIYWAENQFPIQFADREPQSDVTE
jgi:hypothetical protein